MITEKNQILLEISSHNGVYFLSSWPIILVFSVNMYTMLPKAAKGYTAQGRLPYTLGSLLYVTKRAS